MTDKKLDGLIHSLLYAETLHERMEAQLDVRFDFEGLSVLRPILEVFLQYIRELVTGQCAPRDDNLTPFLQFHDAFGQIQYLLWAWRDEGEPIIETLIEMLDDTDRSLRALAIVSLGAGNMMWKEATMVEPYIRARLKDSNFLIRAAARSALEYMQLGEYVERKMPPDTAIQQRMEQYAAQVMSGLVSIEGR